MGQSFVEPASLCFRNEKAVREEALKSEWWLPSLAHRCQKSCGCQEKLQEENRGLRPGSNLSPGQGKVDTDLMESFGSWEYKRTT